MGKILYVIGLIWGICLLLPGCTEEEWVLHPEEPEDPVEMKPNEFFDFTVAFDDSERAIYASMSDVPASGDMNYVENQTFTDVVTVVYDEKTVQVDNPNPMIMVMNNGTDVEIHSFMMTGVEYVLKGKCADGSFKMSTSNADYKIVLSDLELSNPDGAAVYVLPTVRSKAFVYAEEGTVNKLKGCLNENSTEKACVKSGSDLIFCGSGTTEVYTNYRHAVETKGNVYFRGGCRLKITTADNGMAGVAEQPKDGVHAGGDVVMTGGEVDIVTVGDGIQSESGSVRLEGGFLKVVTSGEKSHAVKAGGNVDIYGGAFHALVKGNASKCISSDGGLNMSDGKVTLVSEGAAVYNAEMRDMSSCAGIKTVSDIRINGGVLQINSTGDAGKGINTDGALWMDGHAEVKVITSGKKAVIEGVDSNPKGISADAGITMGGKLLWVNTLGGTSGSDGLATKNSITFNKGEIRLRSYDDCVKADRDITVNGGVLCCYSDGNDGLDANGRVAVNGGLVISCGAALSSGDRKGEGVDCGDFVISGGTVVALGGGETMPSSASTQNSVLYKTDATWDANDVLYVEDKFNENIVMFQLPGSFNSLNLMFGTERFKTGETYRLYKGLRKNVEGDSDIFGYFTNAVCRDGIELCSFGVQGSVTQVGGW